ncbi:NAC domain-containing protein JA2L [Sesamum alatum]|uniref:NAC domain-containing protein JA2L n=1 Tax=Sesamum alatum TaxID=300844 RepID=A0AAE1Y030_9LAMI|nr:NAC domain-containing protein JA2L [Sesamum alatum]
MGLDDWVLCRIYKKNSGGGGGEKPALSGAQSKEYSHGSPSPSSCSSQHEDVLESLPEIGDRFFSLPRMNSLENFEQEDQKLMNLQRLGSWNFDWATVAGLGPIWAEDVQAQHDHTRNDMYAADAVVDEEVQSGLVNQRDMAGFGQGFYGSLDPFGVRYPAQPLGSGFRQ